MRTDLFSILFSIFLRIAIFILSASCRINTSSTSQAKMKRNGFQCICSRSSCFYPTCLLVLFLPLFLFFFAPPPFHHPHYKFSYSLLFILSFAASPALELTIRLFACIPNKSIFCIESCLYSLKMHFIVTCCNFYCVRIIVAMYIFAIYIIFGMCGSMLHRILHR